jgi:hypothetical protein
MESILKNFRPQPHILDLRSLLLFRILFGLYLSYDVISRLLPFPLSVEWYTGYSDDDDIQGNNSLLHPTDSPHGNVIHKVWFARTSATIQYMLFATTLVLSLALSLGRLQAPVTRLALWLLVVSMQHRCMHVHDGRYETVLARQCFRTKCRWKTNYFFSLDSKATTIQDNS